MQKQFHILNGDALLNRFPVEIKGTRYIIRECLLEGSLDGVSLKDFFENRAEFIEDFFDVEPGKYYNISVSEFEKILSIPENSEINLWFEDDLYCQVNFWFSAYLISQNNKNQKVYLVRPNSGNEYNFGKMSEIELFSAFQNRIRLHSDDIDLIVKLWNYYSQDNRSGLKETGKAFQKKFPFIPRAIEAHLERFPHNGNPGRPAESLKQIIKDLKTTDISLVFREFCNRETIYGYSDLQVKKMLNEILKNNNDGNTTDCR